MNKLPLARHTDIVVQQLGREVLVYNLKTHKAYNLNETSAAVYQSCDGKTSFDELKIKHKFTDDLIFLALDELRRENLIEDDKSLVSPLAGMSRREAIRKVGLGSIIALPLISSLIAPTAAHAQSGAITCASICTCTFAIADETSTTCKDPGCGNAACTCQANRNNCTPLGVPGERDEEPVNEQCGGECVAPGGEVSA